MKLELVLFCNSAHVDPDGLISILRGGYESIDIKDFPQRGIITLVIRLRCDPDECNKERPFESTIVGPGGATLRTKISMPLTVPLNSFDATKPATMTIKLDYYAVDFEQPGKYEFTFSVGGIPLDSASIEVRKA